MFYEVLQLFLKKKEVVDSVSSSFGTSHYFEGELRSDYMRNQFFESAIPYVAPVAYNLPFFRSKFGGIILVCSYFAVTESAVVTFCCL